MKRIIKKHKKIIYKSVFYGCLVIVLLASCNTQTSSNISVNNIVVSHSDEYFDFNSILNYSHCVILETSDESLIGYINKVQIKNQIIYISDVQSNTISCFNLDGSFLKKINKKGQSKSEYLQLTDFEVMNNGNIVIYDGVKGCILEYNDDSLVSLKQVVNGGVAFKLLKNDLLAINLGNGISTSEKNENHNYLCVNNKNNIVKKELLFNEAYLGRRFAFGERKSYFYQFGDNLYMTSIMDDVVYKLDEEKGDILPFVQFDLGTKRPNHNTSKGEAMEYIDKLNDENSTSPYALYVKGDTVLMSYDYSLRTRIACASTNGEFAKNGLLGKDINGLQINIIPYLDSDNYNYVLSKIESSSFEKLLNFNKKKGIDSKVLNEIIAKNKGGDNPVLVFYEWK